MRRTACWVTSLVALVLAMGCEQTIDPEPSTISPPRDSVSTGNSALGGAIRAADKTADKIADQQQELIRQMEEDQR